MSIQLICDQCGQASENLQEIRPISVSRGDQSTYRGEYVTGQLHWQCIVAFVARRDAEKNELAPW